MSGRPPIYIFNNDIAFIVDGSPVFHGSVAISSTTTSGKRGVDEETTNNVPYKKAKSNIKGKINVEADGTEETDQEDVLLSTDSEIDIGGQARQETFTRDQANDRRTRKGMSGQRSATAHEVAEGCELGTWEPHAIFHERTSGKHGGGFLEESDGEGPLVSAGKSGFKITKSERENPEGEDSPDGERALVPAGKSERDNPEAEDASKLIVSNHINAFEVTFMEHLEGNDIPQVMINCLVNKAAEAFRTIHGLGPLEAGIVPVFSARISETLEPLVSTMTAAARSLITRALSAAISYVASTLGLKENEK